LTTKSPTTAATTNLTPSAATSTTKSANDEDVDYKDDEADIKFSPDEAIELFQRNVKEKEKNIGGILNATATVYRHFNLQHSRLYQFIVCTKAIMRRKL